MLLVSGGTAVFGPLFESDADIFGPLAVPRAGNKLPERGRWAADNDACNGFNEARFLAMLERHAHAKDRCVFVTCPDIVNRTPAGLVGDHAATLAQFREWEPRLHAMGWPVAFVAQDGCDADLVPWDRCEALFIGGSDPFKEGPAAARIAARARQLGKWLHMGRVNTKARIRYALLLECDSVDGSGWSRFSRSMLADYGHLFKQQQRGLFELRGEA